MIDQIRRLLLLLFLLATPSYPLYAKTVTSTFQLANRAFNQGDYVTAVRILRVILKKYPDHQASAFLMGRTLYRMGRPKMAAPYFRRSGDFMNADGSFEYGIVFFTVENCGKAIDRKSVV